MSLLKGTSVTVYKPIYGELDSMGEPTISWIETTVENVLFQPTQSGGTGTHDLEVDRINGVSITPTFHFPKTYTESLRGCKIQYGGNEYRVVGDPQPFMIENTPGDWNRTVPCEVAYG